MVWLRDGSFRKWCCTTVLFLMLGYSAWQAFAPARAVGQETATAPAAEAPAAAPAAAAPAEVKPDSTGAGIGNIGDTGIVPADQIGRAHV